MRVEVVGTSNTLYYVLKDHLGSASVTLDASGNVVANGEQRYYPFGESRISGAALPTDRLFQSQRDVGLGGLDVLDAVAGRDLLESHAGGKGTGPWLVRRDVVNHQRLGVVRLETVREEPLDEVVRCVEVVDLPFEAAADRREVCLLPDDRRVDVLLRELRKLDEPARLG